MGTRPWLIAVVGMVREARIISGEGVTVVVGGGDAVALERRLAETLDRIPTTDSGGVLPLLLSFGVCGGLSPSLKVGDIIIAASVISEGRRRPTDGLWAERLAKALPGAHLADMAAGEAMIGSIADKRALRLASGAATVDMDSHVVARTAERYALPFAVVRAVSDAADHALPPAAGRERGVALPAC